MDLAGKVALVTGGANGIGLEYVRQLIKADVEGVTVVDLDETGGADAVEEFGASKVQFLATDVTKELQLKAAFDETISRFGRLDVVVNNAGICNDEKVDELVDVNVRACVKGTLLGFDYMGKDKGGNGGIILNTGSIVGINPTFTLPLYSASKAFIIAWTRSFGHPFYHDLTGVKVMSLAPGATMTNIYKGFSYSQRFAGLAEISDSTDPRLKVQTTETVGEAFIKVLKEGDNGSIWVVNNNKPVYREENIPDFIDTLI